MPVAVVRLQPYCVLMDDETAELALASFVGGDRGVA